MRLLCLTFLAHSGLLLAGPTGQQRPSVSQTPTVDIPRQMLPPPATPRVNGDNTAKAVSAPVPVESSRRRAGVRGKNPEIIGLRQVSRLKFTNERKPVVISAPVELEVGVVYVFSFKSDWPVSWIWLFSRKNDSEDSNLLKAPRYNAMKGSFSFELDEAATVQYHLNLPESHLLPYTGEAVIFAFPDIPHAGDGTIFHFPGVPWAS